MADVLGVVMTILFVCAIGFIAYRLLEYMKNNHYCDRVYADG